MKSKYNRILIANRGEIAVRINRACHELGIETVGIYSKIDEGALHTRLTDYKICVGKANSKESYLNSYNILAAAKEIGADAIHPGIGYFAENGDFAELCAHYNIDFISPGAENLRLMGNKLEAKKIAKECGIPVVGGNLKKIQSIEECKKYIPEVGLPIILKAANGGGGKGIRIIHTEDELEIGFEQCKKEVESTFGESIILIEKYIENAKHIEVQILGDKYGNILCLGERECSLQRANQKLIEEARCDSITDEVRKKLYEDCIKICKRIKYYGPGTIEFLYQKDGSYYFMEMNTRLQVEHPITELITGIDLVIEQIRVSQGLPLQYAQNDITYKGYALECRILAEYFNKSFIPSFGKITKWNLPGGPGVRIDNGYEIGNKVTPFYDSLLAKICCHGSNKENAIKKMLCCLNEFEIGGVQTNIEFMKTIISNQQFIEGEYYTSTIDNYIKQQEITK